MVLPAPFSPSRPRISPDSTVRSTESLAMTPGNRLVMPLSSSRSSASGPSRRWSLTVAHDGHRAKGLSSPESEDGSRKTEVAPARLRRYRIPRQQTPPAVGLRGGSRHDQLTAPVLRRTRHACRPSTPTGGGMAGRPPTRAKLGRSTPSEARGDQLNRRIPPPPRGRCPSIQGPHAGRWRYRWRAMPAPRC